MDGYRWRQNGICKPKKDSVTTEVYFHVNKYHKDSFLTEKIIVFHSRPMVDVVKLFKILIETDLKKKLI